MSKVILVNSPIFRESTDNGEQYLPPLGLGYIATYIDKNGDDVEIYDTVKQHQSIQQIINYLNYKNPEYIGLNIFTVNYELVKQICEELRVDSIILLGGKAASFLVDYIINWKVNNKIIIVQGEGEYVIPAIIRSAYNEINKEAAHNKYVVSVDKNSSYFPRDLSEQELNRSFFKDEIIHNHYKQNEACIVTSRGCPYLCAFCGGSHALNSNIPIRIRNKESVIKEISNILVNNPRVQSIRVLDDLFIRNHQSILNAAYIFERFPNITFRAMAHVQSFSEPYINEMKILKQCGCKELFLGVESGSTTIRRMIHKEGSLDKIKSVAQAALQVGLDLKCYYIYGFPNESYSDMKMTYEFANSLYNISKYTDGSMRTSVFQFRPYHGTELYNQLLHENKKIENYKLDNKSGNKVRKQFDIVSGNFSAVTDDELQGFIKITQNLVR